MFLEISQNSQENPCARVSILLKLQASACNFIKKETLAPGFSCEFCEISKNAFFTEHLIGRLLLEYETRNRRDGNKFGGGAIEYVRRGFICNWFKKFETKSSETICSEIKIVNQIWLRISVYIPPSSFFKKLENSVSKAYIKYDKFIVSKAYIKYDKFIIMGDFTIDVKKPECLGYNELERFCDTLKLTNLIKKHTCITKDHKSAIGLILINKPLSFQVKPVTEAGISDFHKFIYSFLKSICSRLKSKHMMTLFLSRV